MSYTIDIQTNQYPTDEDRLRQAVTVVLDQHDVSDRSSLSIVFADNHDVQKLNLQHRDIDAPTDVLSFPADPLPEFMIGEPPYLGDIIIAYPYTATSVEKQDVDLNETFCLLVIHGTLHLLGYDHATVDEKADMWQAQADALTCLEISPAIVDQYGKISDD